MTRVWQWIFIGNLRDAERLVVTNSLNIGAVLTLCPEEVVHARKVKYVHLGITDSRPIPEQIFERIMLAVQEGVRQSNLPVHCVGGTIVPPLWSRCGCSVVVTQM